MPYFSSRTNLTLYVTTPMKYTATSFFRSVRLWNIATPTTHKVTTFNSDGGCIAFSPLCSFEIYRCVSITKRWRGFKIHQIPPSWRLVVAIYWSESKFIFPSFPLLFLSAWASIIWKWKKDCFFINYFRQ